MTVALAVTTGNIGNGVNFSESSFRLFSLPYSPTNSYCRAPDIPNAPLIGWVIVLHILANVWGS